MISPRYLFVKNKDGWEGGGLINFPPLKRGSLLERGAGGGGGLFEMGGLIEDLRLLFFISALVVRYITKRFIGEYARSLGKTF